MKTLKCDLCEVTAQGETFEDWKEAIMPHYMEAHPDVINQNSDLSDEEKKSEMDNWMAENKARFEAA